MGCIELINGILIHINNIEIDLYIDVNLNIILV